MSTSKCSKCDGDNVWTIVGALGLEQYCRDCDVLCDCGKRYPREGNQACPSCKRPQPVESDDERVAEWMKLLREGGRNTQLVENLGRIGPAGRAAIPMLEEIFRKHGKNDFFGCAAYDALREHKYNAPQQPAAAQGSQPGCLVLVLFLATGITTIAYRLLA